MAQHGARRGQHGLSIVELMVGVTIGLLVVAAATVMISGQLVENRRLLVEAQLQQDLRAASDIITRDIRRAGGLGERTIGIGLQYVNVLDTLETVALTATSTVASPPAAKANPTQASLTIAAGSGTCTVAGLPGGVALQFDYFAGLGTTYGAYQYRRLASRGVLQHRDVTGSAQDLTDATTMDVTEFCVRITQPISVPLPCAKPCPDSTTSCWPTYQVRTVNFTIKAQGRGVNADIKRQMSSTVRLRNDNIRYSAAVAPAICPA
jgi:type IV pilus assembly protein PilW